MKPPKTKTEALDLLRCIKEDFTMLMNGEWDPDDASCLASIEVVEALIKFVKELK